MAMEFPFHIGRLREGHAPSFAPDTGCGYRLMASFENRIIGVLYAHEQFFGKPFVETLRVDPEFLRFGVARELMKRFREGRSEVWGAAKMSDATARAYFKEMGFAECGCIEGVGDDDPKVMMQWKARV